MIINTEGVIIDNQIEDGDPEIIRRFAVANKMSRGSGIASGILKSVVSIPRRVNNKVVGVIDEFDRGTGRV